RLWLVLVRDSRARDTPDSLKSRATKHQRVVHDGRSCFAHSVPKRRGKEWLSAEAGSARFGLTISRHVPTSAGNPPPTSGELESGCREGAGSGFPPCFRSSCRVAQGAAPASFGH